MFGPQHAAHREAVDDRHRHVEQQHVRLVALDRVERLGTVDRRGHRVSLEHQGALQRVAHRPVVLSNEHRGTVAAVVVLLHHAHSVASGGEKWV